MKNRIKSFLALCLLLALFNCEVPFERNTRLLVKGQITDLNNQPVSNANIGVFVRRSNEFTIGLGFNGSGGELIAQTDSGINGNFSMTTLFPITEDLSVEVFVDESYTKYSYKTDVKNFSPTDLTIDLEQIPIRLKSKVNFNISRTSPAETELQYSIAYQTIFCREVYFEEILDEELTLCYETQQTGGTLNDNNPDTTRDFESLLGSEILFTYSINGQPEQSQTLTIDQANYEFNFTY